MNDKQEVDQMQDAAFSVTLKFSCIEAGIEGAQALLDHLKKGELPPSGEYRIFGKGESPACVQSDATCVPQENSALNPLEGRSKSSTKAQRMPLMSLATYNRSFLTPELENSSIVLLAVLLSMEVVSKGERQLTFCKVHGDPLFTEEEIDTLLAKHINLGL